MMSFLLEVEQVVVTRMAMKEVPVYVEVGKVAALVRVNTQKGCRVLL